MSTDSGHLPFDAVIEPADTEVTHTSDDGVHVLRVRTRPGTDVKIAWDVPMGAAVTYWTSDSGRRRHFPADWSGPSTASIVADCPAGVLIDATGTNVHAWACSRVVEPVTMGGGVSEERGCYHVWLSYSADDATTELRLDSRPIGYERCLADIAGWWDSAAAPGDPSQLPRELPSAAVQPLYSTWYSYHQRLEAAELEAELALAAEMGMASVIVDDGWQTADAGRGYRYTGDWLPEPSRFPDLAAHVRNVHALGLAEMFWIALPFVGEGSDSFHQYADWLIPGTHAALWDVRLPQARDHVAGICARLVADYGLDGLKIDFIDSWSRIDAGPAPAGADTESMALGVQRLLARIVERIRVHVPNPMIEFRQHYVGPAMLRYGNMFRAGDCPMDGLANRVSTVDLRHLCGHRAVHADMVMWGPDASPEVAAEQLLCTLFSVPQISVRLAELSSAHRQMLQAYLDFWRAHAEVVLHGDLAAPRPDLNYPTVAATRSGRTVAAVYDQASVLPVVGGRTVVANATGQAEVLVDLVRPARLTELVDCRGRDASRPGAPVSAGKQLPTGLARLPVPRGGRAVLELA